MFNVCDVWWYFKRFSTGKRANLKDDSSSDEEFKPGEASDASEEKPRKRKRGRGKRGSSEEDEASLSEASSDESDVSWVICTKVW